MAFIKEENEDIKIEEAFRGKQEDTDEQTGWFSFSKLKSTEMNDIVEECHVSVLMYE